MVDERFSSHLGGIESRVTGPGVGDFGSFLLGVHPFGQAFLVFRQLFLLPVHEERFVRERIFRQQVATFGEH